jgi:hypothetical protein
MGFVNHSGANYTRADSMSGMAHFRARRDDAFCAQSEKCIGKTETRACRGAVVNNFGSAALGSYSAAIAAGRELTFSGSLSEQTSTTERDLVHPYVSVTHGNLPKMLWRVELGAGELGDGAVGDEVSSGNQDLPVGEQRRRVA